MQADLDSLIWRGGAIHLVCTLFWVLYMCYWARKATRAPAAVRYVAAASTVGLCVSNAALYTWCSTIISAPSSDFGEPSWDFGLAPLWIQLVISCLLVAIVLSGLAAMWCVVKYPCDRESLPQEDLQPNATH